MDKQRKRSPAPRVRKETIRKLADRALTPGDLEQVAGGYHSYAPRYTQCCG